MTWRPQRLLATAALACAQSVAAQGLDSQAPDEALASTQSSFSVQFDNDLFSGLARDQDYSWGAAATFASPSGARPLVPLDRLRDWLALNLGAQSRDESALSSYASQLGILAMTPHTLTAAEPIRSDRPYASLIFISSSETRVLEDSHRVRFTSVSVGALGLNLAETLQRAVHRTMGGELPRGWEHQISEGGELTMRYVQAGQWLLAETRQPHTAQWESKLTLSGSAGYLTEAMLAWSGRWGRIQSPWWGFAPELGDYTSAPIASTWRSGTGDPMELFAFAGVRLKARVYNALLQGQFRHSDVRVDGDDLAHVQVEGWLGVAVARSDLRVSYTIRCASPEITREPGRRSPIWAGISVEKSF